MGGGRQGWKALRKLRKPSAVSHRRRTPSTPPVAKRADPGGAILLDVAPGEYWWGGDASDGYRMPFADGYHADLRRSGDSQAMPLLVSSHGRYVWSEYPFTIKLADSTLMLRPYNGAQIEIGRGELTLRGGYLAGARHFAAGGGRPADIMFTAPQYNLWIEMLFQPTQDAVLDYAGQVIEHGFPPGVLVIDDMWSEAYGTWTFHTGRFPDPRAMVTRLHDLGFAVMLWIVPLVTPDTPGFRSLAERGLLIADASGRPVVGRWWNGFGAAIDLLNPGAVAWLTAILEGLRAEMGIDGFKFDGGDTSFYRSIDVVDPERYTAAWNALAAGCAMNELRAAWKAAGLPLAQRQRDKAHSWAAKDGLASLIPNGLAQGLTGHAYTCPDMVAGGDYLAFPASRHSASFDPELFVRSAQCQALFPMMQFSAAPWRLLDRRHLNLCVAAARLHVEYGAEILRLADAAAVTGEPIQRHLSYVFPGHGYESVCDQFMLGDDLMVAPAVVRRQLSRRLVIPPGDWLADDGTKLSGPTQAEISVPLGRLPRFRRIAA